MLLLPTEHDWLWLPGGTASAMHTAAGKGNHNRSAISYNSGPRFQAKLASRGQLSEPGRIKSKPPLTAAVVLVRDLVVRPPAPPDCHLLRDLKQEVHGRPVWRQILRSETARVRGFANTQQRAQESAAARALTRAAARVSIESTGEPDTPTMFQPTDTPPLSAGPNSPRKPVTLQSLSVMP